VAELNGRPFPPGDYPAVVVGSGAGGLQTSYFLERRGVRHALLSGDDAPAGMFQRFPFFQRLISWTKPYAPVERGTRAYERYDWNSLLGEEPEHRTLLPELMDGTSYFPSRDEMERGMARFVERTGLRVRYGCRWEGTRREDDAFVISTSDGEYRCQVAIFAVGMTKPWKPDIQGLDQVPHYVETRPPREYANKRVVIIGKRNSGFELADGLLPWASQIILVSPRPARISVVTHSLAGARARYLQPYEDYVLAGGTFVLDAAIDRVERRATGYRVLASGTTRPGDVVLDADEVIAATGFSTPLQDLPELGVATFYQGRLPAQTPFWESASVPGIYFGGSVSQGSIGLKKYGKTGNSAAVHGFRYNARVLADHLAAERFGIELQRPTIRPERLVPFLLSEATEGPELYNQPSYLARVVTLDRGRGIRDEGIFPLAYFVDSSGPDAVAITVETDDQGDTHPAVYVRREGRVDEHLLNSEPMLDFRTNEHRNQLTAVLQEFVE
jgi:thioredoxin reductase